MRLIPPWSWRERSAWIEENPRVASVYLGLGSAAVLSVLVALDVGVMGGIGWFLALALVMPYVTWRQLTRHGVGSNASVPAGDGPTERLEDAAAAPPPDGPARDPASLFRGVVEQLSRASPFVLVLCIIAGVGGATFSVIDALGQSDAEVLLGVPGNVGLIVLPAMALHRRRARAAD